MSDVELMMDVDYKNDLKEGNGIFFYLDGRKYDGQWKDGKKDGHGKMKYNNGD